jgi:hypothetical protein
VRAFTLGFAVLFVATAAWGQERGPADASFRVSWEPRFGAPATIGGRVYNDSTYRVTNVRLRIEGLDADSRPVGQKLAWALGDIVPGGETSFVAESVPGAVSYRIAVHSFSLVSVGQAP